jgi:hypothetical protein
VIHYLYLVFNEENDYYVGRRSSKKDPSQDKYMGSSSDKTFNPVKKNIIAICDSYEELKSRERSLICRHIGHPKNKNKMVPPINDAWGTFKWATNEQKNIQIRDGILPSGFRWGRMRPFGETHPTKGTTQWIKDGETKRSKNCPGEGWVPGSYYNGKSNFNPTATKGYFWVTNGGESKLLPPDSEIPNGWKKGRTS